ncbi:MAG: hypothetical protein HY890_03040 [Deltaproteobacteria bacterium]|nr:hypothetical protein [Deltaproteobacteria bacterium]
MPVAPILLGIEVFATILALFIFGSIKYRIDKNAVTYGALLIILATFLPMWWPGSQLRQEFIQNGVPAILNAAKENLLSLHGLEKLAHADTMLFILGLTFFVAVISQTRLLESISMNILRIFEGRVFFTVLVIGGLVSFASGILDGVSMIGLTIRVLVIILVMARVDSHGIKFITMVSVIMTTVCGMWLAYGEPPNLIMKSNLSLPDSFFLKYAMPMAAATFVIVAYFIYARLRGVAIPLDELDVLEQNIADVRFMQAAHKGKTREMEEMLKDFAGRLGDKAAAVDASYHEGHHPISAMCRAGVDRKITHEFIGEYLGEEFKTPVFSYYCHRVKRKRSKEVEHEMVHADVIERLMETTRLQRHAAQTWGKIAFVPFIALLFWHAKNHEVPLFVSSLAGFGFAFMGILPHPKMRRLALLEAAHEYREYLFLFPLFLSISLLTAVGFFDQAKGVIEYGISTIGNANVAVIQFIGSGLLSAILDNNVVADITSRAIHGMPNMFLFAATQIAGYATGGSLTHIGSAQSVVAFAFILRYLDPNFTPLDWIRAMWKLVLAITIVLTAVIYIMAFVVAV